MCSRSSSADSPGHRLRRAGGRDLRSRRCAAAATREVGAEAGALVGARRRARRRRGSHSATSASVRPGDLWPFLLVGAARARASRRSSSSSRSAHAGPSRAAILIGTAPLISVLIALIAPRRAVPRRAARGTVLIVAGGAILSRERVRPADFRALGAAARPHLRRAVRACATTSSATLARRAHAPPLARVGGLAARRQRSRARLPRSSSAAAVCRRSCGRALPAFAPAGVTLGLALRVPRRGLRPRPRQRRRPAQRDAVAVGGAFAAIADRAKRGDRPSDGASRALLVLAGGAMISVLR